MKTNTYRDNRGNETFTQVMGQATLAEPIEATWIANGRDCEAQTVAAGAIVRFLISRPHVDHTSETWRQGVILASEDGGKHWRRYRYFLPQDPTLVPVDGGNAAGVGEAADGCARATT